MEFSDGRERSSRPPASSSVKAGWAAYGPGFSPSESRVLFCAGRHRHAGGRRP